MAKLIKVFIFVFLVLVFLWELRKGYFKYFIDYLKSFSLKPNSRLLLTLFGLFAIVFTMDFAVLQFCQQWNHHSFSKGVMEFGRMLGRNKNFWYALGSAYLISSFLHRKIALHVFGAMLASALAALTAGAVKFIFLRARPENEFGPYSFFNLNGVMRDSGLFDSFPSGDVTLVAAACGYFFFVFQKSIFRWIFMVLPFTTAFSRLWLNRHWPSDVLLGLFFGFTFGYFVWNYYQKYFGKSAAVVQDGLGERFNP